MSLSLAVLGLHRCAGFFSGCDARACHCGGCSCCRAQAPGRQGSVVAAPGLWSGSPAAVAHRLCCSVACGTFPDQGSNLCPAFAGGLSASEPPRKPRGTNILIISAFHRKIYNQKRGNDNRKCHILMYRQVILAYTWVSLSLMLTRIACLQSTKHALYVCFNYWRKGCIDQNERTSMLKIRVKCLPFWSTNACILFNDKTPLPGANAILTRWVCTDLIFEILREYILDLCDVLCSGQT